MGITYTKKEAQTIRDGWQGIMWTVDALDHKWEWGLTEAKKLAKKDNCDSDLEAKARVICQFLKGYDQSSVPIHTLDGLCEWAIKAQVLGAGLKSRKNGNSYIGDELNRNKHHFKKSRFVEAAHREARQRWLDKLLG